MAAATGHTLTVSLCVTTGPHRDEEDGQSVVPLVYQACIATGTTTPAAWCRAYTSRTAIDQHCPPLQVAFIKQEALEKAREIKVKADEEFAIEKVSRRFRSLIAPQRARRLVEPTIQLLIHTLTFIGEDCQTRNDQH